jgi:ABC-2 type transport system permease protein
VTLKELRYIQRDRATLFLVLFSPSLLLILMAYSMTAEILHVPVGVLDFDRSQTSRSFIQTITLGDDLDLFAQVGSMLEVETLLLEEEIHVAVVIPSGFEKTLYSVSGMPLQVIVDGTEPQTGGYAVDRIIQRAESFVLDLLSRQLASIGIDQSNLAGIDLRVRAWYNPNLKGSVDGIPGILSLALGIPGLSVALTMAKERERGTFEQLLATPITRTELLLGKISPYILSGLVNTVLTTVVALALFHIPMQGNFLLFLGLSAIFFFALLSMGMIIGVFFRTQAGAMSLSFLAIFVPGFFLTGIFFPLASMPPIVRMEALALPGSHYAIITRGIFITGLGIDVLWPYALALFGLGLVFTGIAAVFFKKKLA